MVVVCVCVYCILYVINATYYVTIPKLFTPSVCTIALTHNLLLFTRERVRQLEMKGLHKMRIYQEKQRVERLKSAEYKSAHQFDDEEEVYAPPLSNEPDRIQEIVTNNLHGKAEPTLISESPSLYGKSSHLGEYF